MGCTHNEEVPQLKGERILVECEALGEKMQKPTKTNWEDWLSCKPCICTRSITWRDINSMNIIHFLKQHIKECDGVNVLRWNVKSKSFIDQ